jgi:hypothetical protein
MIYNKITNPKQTLYLKVIAMIVLFAFSLTLSSCVTAYSEDITPQEFKTLSNPESETISKITTKDSIIDGRTYGIRYRQLESSFLLEKIDSLFVSKSIPRAYKLKRTLTELKLADINKLSIQHSKFAFGKTMMWTGIGLGTILVLGVIMYLIDTPKSTINFSFH